jgi:hypothetical protein
VAGGDDTTKPRRQGGLGDLKRLVVFTYQYNNNRIPQNIRNLQDFYGEHRTYAVLKT